MVLILVIGIALIAVAAGLFVHALALPRRRAAETVGQIMTYSFEAPLPVAAADAGTVKRRPLSNMLDSFASGVGTRFRGRIPGVKEQELQRLLLSAGLYTVSPAKIV